jgi:hypothetical protein
MCQKSSQIRVGRSSHTRFQFSAGSSEFNLMQQFRGNLNGFDCDVIVLSAQCVVFCADALHLPGPSFRYELKLRFCRRHNFQFGDLQRPVLSAF